MSKMSDMAATIEELRTAAAAINDAANWLAEMFSGAGDAEPTAPAEPALTLEQVRAVLADKSRQGHTAETSCSAFSVNSLVCTSDIFALQSLG